MQEPELWMWVVSGQVRQPFVMSLFSRWSRDTTQLLRLCVSPFPQVGQYLDNSMIPIINLHDHFGCISLAKSKIGLLRDVTRIRFWERKKNPKRYFSHLESRQYFSTKTSYHKDCFWILFQRNTKIVIQYDNAESD